MFHRTKMTVIAVALAATTATAAHAAALGTVGAIYDNNSPTGKAKIYFDFGETKYSNVYVYTGRSNFEVDSVSPELTGVAPFTVGNEFQAFCVDFQQEIFQDNEVRIWELVELSKVPYPDKGGYTGGMGDERASWLQRLFEQNYGSIDDPYPNTDDQRKINATAFQIAAWHLIYEADVNETNEDVHSEDNTHFRVNDITSPTDDQTIYTLANDWVADAKANGPSDASVYALRSAGTQDFAILLDDFEPNSPPEAVPLPAAAWMGMVLLGSLATGGGIRRLRWKDA